MDQNRRRRGGLFRKYGVVLGVVIGGTLLISGAVDLFFSYRDHTAAITRAHSQEVDAAAGAVQRFIDDVVSQITWADPVAGLSESSAAQRRREAYYRLFNQAPAISEVRYVDEYGREQLFVAYRELDRVASDIDLSGTPAFIMAKSQGSYFGPVTFREGSEPYMTVSVAERGASAGVTIAEVNLKLIWNIVERAEMHDGVTSYVVDGTGHLVAHPNISLVLRVTDVSQLPQVHRALDGLPALPAGFNSVSPGVEGQAALTVHRRIEPMGWYVFVEEPVAEAFAPVFDLIRRTVLIFGWGLGLAAVASLLLAGQMVAPIRALRTGAAQIARGALEQRVAIRTGDELEELADEFNNMASRVRDAQEGLERQVADRTRELRDALVNLEEKSEQLAQISKNKTDFLNFMSHDLRNPLNSIIGFSRVLKEQMYGPVNDKQQEYLEDILSSANLQKRLVNNLLDIAKIEAGQMDLEFSRFILRDALRSALTMVREDARSGAVSLRLEVADEMMTIEADEGRVQQITLNLLSNAVKYTPPGGQVTVTAHAVGDEAWVAVADSGIGIAPEDQARVFQQFQRVARRAVRQRQGTGLGLSLTRLLVELHGGRIWVESELNVGTTFTFTLPLSRSSLPAASSDGGQQWIAAPAPQQTEVEASIRRVLVVDDDPQAVRLVDAVLRPQGYEVLGATDGEGGLEAVRRERPGLVILDLRMPGMDGYAVVDRLRADPDLDGIPIVVLTGEEVDATGRARLGSRVSELLRKGDFTFSRLTTLVQTYFQGAT